MLKKNRSMSVKSAQLSVCVVPCFGKYHTVNEYSEDASVCLQQRVAPQLAESVSVVRIFA